jgi:hypothetical protein
MAALTAHHLQPPPAALLSITGITTFRHPFFNTSVLLTPKPITDDEVRHHVSAPVSVGASEEGDPTVFCVDKLLPDGAKNPNYKTPAAGSGQSEDELPRGCLYDYYLYKNAYVDLVGDVDPGFDWAKTDSGMNRKAVWPDTVIIQGTGDDDVDLRVSTHMADCLGEEKVKLCLADGQGHLFESRRFLEDSAPGMDAVRAAVDHLERIIF